MKNIRIVVITIFMGLIFTTTVIAQDEHFNDSSNADSGHAGDEEEFIDFNRFTDISVKPALNWNGSLLFTTRYMIDYDTLGKSTVFAYPELRLKLQYENAHSELFTRLDFSQDVIFNDFDDFIDEAYIRLYYNRFYLEAGYLKVVWGKGDDIHVIDVLNPIDYSDFINKDYVERKLAEKMIKVNVGIGNEGLLEFVYVPVFTADKFALEGFWMPAVLEPIAGSLPEENTLSDIFPDTSSLDYGQYAVRYTSTVNGFDIGALYYYGYLREPSINMLSMAVNYDRVHIFGAEAAAALFGFNWRSEIGYYLTNDTKGDDPLVHNNLLGYVLGFDKDLPISSMNINIQVYGSYIIGNNRITAADMEYDADDNYWQNILVTSLTDSYYHENIRPELSFIYSIENGDYMIRTKGEFSLRDDILLTAQYTVFGGNSDSNYRSFGQFSDNDFIQVSFEYAF